MSRKMLALLQAVSGIVIAGAAVTAGASHGNVPSPRPPAVCVQVRA
jgi:hypothetical protein